MKPISSRMQYALVGVGYATVLAVAAALLFVHHLVELQDPAAASGGMAAAGETMLHVFIGGLFLVPTAFLIWVIRTSEALYSAYSRILFGLSLSAPVCLAVVLLDGKYVPQSLGWLCLYRVEQLPVCLVGMGVSRWAARFDRAKRLASYALLVEGLTLGFPVAAFIVAIFLHR